MTATIDTRAARRVTPTGVLVLPSTAPRADWLTARRDGITATDIVKIVGATKYGSAVDVWADKNGEPLVDDELSEAGEWGVELEDYVARRWAEIHDVRVRRIGLIRNDTDPVALASLDREVIGCPDGRCALEVKTRNAWVLDEWTDGIPDSVAVQCQWQLDVSGLDHIHVAALIGGQRLVEHVVRPDEVVQSWLRIKAHETWAAVMAGTLPTVDPALMTVDLLDRIYADRDGDRVVDGDIVRRLLAEYQEASEGAKAFEETKDRIKVELLSMLADGEFAVDADGVILFTYKAQTSRRTDLKALEAEHPDVYAAVVTESTSRVFRPNRKVVAA